MGMLIEGRWCDDDRVIENGVYNRPPSYFGRDLPAGVVEGLRAEPGRYHLIASLSCPWSQRATLIRHLKALTDDIPLHLAGGPRVQGYAVNAGARWRVPGTDRTIAHLHELYSLSEPAYTGRVTVPVLWDSKVRRIVSNESARIMRACDAAPGTEALDYTLVPDELAAAIDGLNRQLHQGLSNAAYRAGFAERQDAYAVAVKDVFDTMNDLERRLTSQRYLHGGVITESDWRLFPSLVRFDAVYYVLFRCSRRRLVDYPKLWAYARDLFGWAGVAETVDFDAIREGAYLNDRNNNRFGLVAVAPDANWRAPHGREHLGPAKVALRTGGRLAVDPSNLLPV
jgi:putative glutathione S-transferase